MTNGRFVVLERAKVSQEMADFISQIALKNGCSRSQVIRDAIEQMMSYETSVVLDTVRQIQQMNEDINNRLIAMGQYEASRFDQILKAIKAYRK